VESLNAALNLPSYSTFNNRLASSRAMLACLVGERRDVFLVDCDAYNCNEVAVLQKHDPSLVFIVTGDKFMELSSSSFVMSMIRPTCLASSTRLSISAL
jgi:hypothetical protein